METEDLGQELENDHPTNGAGNALPETVRIEPPRTRSKTRSSFRFPSPVCLSDDEDEEPQNGYTDTLLSAEEYNVDSSNYATLKSKGKPKKRTVIATSGTATSRASKAGTTAPPKGNASGAKPNSGPFRPPTAAAHAAAMRAVWPTISAPGATIFDQHDDAPPNATTRPDDAFGDHPGDM